MVSLLFGGCIKSVQVVVFSNDDSCPQLEVLRGRDGRDGRNRERGIPRERGEKGEREGGWDSLERKEREEHMGKWVSKGREGRKEIREQWVSLDQGDLRDRERKEGREIQASLGQLDIVRTVDRCM